MNLIEQIQALIAGAPDIESQMSVAAIAPTLQRIAETLPLSAYYIRQSSQGEWVVNVLSHRQSKLEVKVIYAFNTIEDISKIDESPKSEDLGIKMPIIHLLFEILSMYEIDRVIFLNNSQNLNLGQEISRQDLEASIIKDLQQQTPSAQLPSSLPPDVC